MPYARSNYWFYSLVLEGGAEMRDGLMQHLASSGIQSRPLWLPNHLQRPYRNCQRVGTQSAEHWHGRVLNLPCSAGITEAEIDRVSGAIVAFMAAQGGIHG